MRSLICALLASMALAAGAQTTTETKVRSIIVHRDSVYVKAMLAAPVSQDIDELLFQAEVLRMAKEPDKANRLELIAEAMILARILGRPSPPMPPTLAEALTEHRLPDQGPVRRDAMQRSIALMVPPPADATVGTVTLAFRNQSQVAITGFNAYILVSPQTTIHCRHAASQPPIEPGATVQVTCKPGEGTASIHFPPGYFLTRELGALTARDNKLAARLGGVPWQDLAAPGAKLSGSPEERVADQRQFELAITLGPLIAGLLLGIAIGARARRPAWTAAKLTLMLVILGIVGPVIVAIFLMPSGNQGDPTGGFGPFLVLVVAVSVGWVAIRAGLLLLVALWPGVLAGSILRPKKTPLPADP